jgi:hypothetical protein
MPTWFRSLFRPRPARRPGRRPTVRPTLLALEDRLVPTVTFHGGALLKNVEVTTVFYGSDWATGSDHAMALQLIDFTRTAVSGSYMDVLTNAGYNVGRGSLVGSRLFNGPINKGVFLEDATLRDYLRAGITSGAFHPNANSLYVIYVEDNVVVREGGHTSRAFFGYHGAFGFAGNDVRYAVVTYPGGTARNSTDPALSTRDTITETASHEIVEAVTDPDVGYQRLGWFDDQIHQEVSDPVNDSVAYLNGYAVQRAVDRYDDPMTFLAATPQRSVSFVLAGNGNLWAHSAAGWSLLQGNVRSVSGQGIDLHGRAMVDAVTNDDRAFEWRDSATGYQQVFLRNNVQLAAAGQGVSYVSVIVDGTRRALWEYQDANRQWYARDGGAGSIGMLDAGTDKFGVNMVDALYLDINSSDPRQWTSHAYEVSDTMLNGTRSHKLGDRVTWVSAGRMGRSEIIAGDNFEGVHIREDTGVRTSLGTGVAEVTSGIDAAGNILIDLVSKDGKLYEYTDLAHRTVTRDGVKHVAKLRGGVLDVIQANADLFERDATGWNKLAGSASAVG